jgi:hypothetical protein
MTPFGDMSSVFLHSKGAGTSLLSSIHSYLCMSERTDITIANDETQDQVERRPRVSIGDNLLQVTQGRSIQEKAARQKKIVS